MFVSDNHYKTPLIYTNIRKIDLREAQDQCLISFKVTHKKTAQTDVSAPLHEYIMYGFLIRKNAVRPYCLPNR